MDNDNIADFKKEIAILRKRLERSEHSRILVEHAMDHYGLVYRASIEQLNAQRNLLDLKNKELDSIRLELIEKNKELLEASITDSLTKIYNRKKIAEILAHEHYQAHLNNTKLSITLMDVDHFKLINDTYGHQVGDLILFEVAHIMKGSLHTFENVGRWGGEEFLIVLPNSSTDAAYSLAERIRIKIAHYHFPIKGHLTCSFGVTEFMKDDKIEHMVKRADIALYKAKKKRNCTCKY